MWVNQNTVPSHTRSSKFGWSHRRHSVCANRNQFTIGRIISCNKTDFKTLSWDKKWYSVLCVGERDYTQLLKANLLTLEYFFCSFCCRTKFHERNGKSRFKMNSPRKRHNNYSGLPKQPLSSLHGEISRRPQLTQESMRSQLLCAFQPVQGFPH